MKSIKKFLASNWPLLLILILAGLVLSYQIDKPFWGHHDWNGVYWGNVARNFARYGPFTTRLGMILNNGFVSRASFNYNFHFSPLFTLIWAVFFQIFGIHNWVSRLMAATFSLSTIGVFYFLVKKFYDRRIAILASLFWIVTPMFIYFGKMPVHEIPLMFFVLLSVYFYLIKRFRFLLLSILISELLTWPGYFLVLAITLHWLILSHRENLTLRQILILWIIAPIVFATLLVHNYLVTGSAFGGGLKEVFFLRVSPVPLAQYLAILTRWAYTYYFLLLPLAGVWLASVFFQKEKRRWDIPLLFLIFALAYPIIFRDSSFRHDYLLIYFWPFLSLASALLITRVRNQLPSATLTVLVLIIFIVFRGRFTLALLDSSLYRESVRVGQYVGPRTKSTDQILIISEDPSVPFDNWFVSFYADRNITVVYEEAKISSQFNKVFYYLPKGEVRID